jgi:hypothetical protein
MQSEQGEHQEGNISPWVGPRGEHRVGMDVVTPPQLQELAGKRISRQQLEELGARRESDDTVITYDGQDWVLDLGD